MKAFRTFEICDNTAQSFFYRLFQSPKKHKSYDRKFTENSLILLNFQKWQIRESPKIPLFDQVWKNEGFPYLKWPLYCEKVILLETYLSTIRFWFLNFCQTCRVGQHTLSISSWSFAFLKKYFERSTDLTYSISWHLWRSTVDSYDTRSTLSSSCRRKSWFVSSLSERVNFFQKYFRAEITWIWCL